jgi:DNA polymerase III subunit delta'
MNIIGHQKIINFLNKSIEKNQLSQAYLFAGPEHLGKFSLALEFARKITRPHRYASSLASEALRAGWPEENQKINPNLIIISPEIEEKKGKIIKKDIKIEKIRELEHNLSLSAYGGKYKIAIIDEAERLTNASQNALLKTLEEPPQKAIIILVTSDINKIIPTIKSRCVIKKFNLIGEAEIKKILKEGSDEEDINFWSLSRPGLAMILQEEKEEKEKRKKAQADLEKILGANLSEKFSFSEELSKNIPEMIQELNFWMVMLRENILGNNKFLRLDQKKALDMIIEIERSLKIIQETNANPRLVLENLMLEIHPME